MSYIFLVLFKTNKKKTLKEKIHVKHKNIQEYKILSREVQLYVHVVNLNTKP